VLVIKVDPNSFGRQLLDNATEIIEVASQGGITDRDPIW
jgi:hypothetical protein